MKYLHALVFALLLHCAYGQTPVWNKELPFTVAGGGLGISLQAEESGFLIAGAKNIVALNEYGEVTGAVLTPFQPPYGLGTFIRSKTDLQTGEKYFLLATATIGAIPQMTISEYRPGQGFVHETVLNEVYGGAAFSPVFVDVNDSTYVILGRKYFRQVTHRPGQGVIVNWEKPNTLGNPNAGIKTADGVVGVGFNGVVFALDTEGNTLWADTTAYSLRDVQMTDDQGFLAAGGLVDSPAALVKISPAGAIEWTREYADGMYNGLLLETDGSITVTGRSYSLQVVLHHLAADGSPLWRKTYQTGSGRTVLRTADGYVIAGHMGAGSFVLRTDAAGHTGPVEARLQPHKRRVQNEVLSVVAAPTSNLFFHGTATGLVAVEDSLTNLFFAAGLWLGALDQDSLLHVAAEVYAIDHADYRSGISQGPAADFDRVWMVTRTQIEALRQDWVDNGHLDQPLPFDISTWPAKGNVHFTHNLDFTHTTLDKSLLPAPFVDANGDGMYAPADGDYPRIKGDQMAWWVITDSTWHTRTAGRPLVVDIGVSMYVHNCQPDLPVGRSLMVDFEVINRSENAYSNMFSGLWTDPDLGCAYDDYIGSLPALNAMYVYNKDTLDGQAGTSCPGGTPTFGSGLPVASIAFTNVALSKFIYYDNGGAIPPPTPGTTDPSTAEQYNFYLQGKWGDGTTPTYNGQPIDFLFPDNPADPTGHTMCAGGGLPAGDRRMLGSHGPFDLAPNDTFLFTLAFTYHPDIPHPCPDIFGTVKDDLEQLQAQVQSGSLEPPANLPTLAYLTPGQSVLLDATVRGATAYAWSNGATTAMNEVMQTGTYSVTITRGTGCAMVETVLVTEATPAHEPDWLDELRLFPNPSTGQFQVEVRGTAREKLEFTLYNSLGQVVQRQVADFQSGALQRTFDGTRLPSGIYTLQLRAGEKTQYVKVVLQR